MRQDLTRYGELLTQIKDRIRRAQVKATLSANAEMILMYWDIGRMIHERQQHEGWGTKVIPQLSLDIRNELPKVKGFSERNIGYMIRFAREYDSHAILQQPVAKLALRDIQKPIGVSEYELTRALPDDLKSSLPTVEEIEAELSREMEE